MSVLFDVLSKCWCVFCTFGFVHIRFLLKGHVQGLTCTCMCRYWFGVVAVPGAVRLVVHVLGGSQASPPPHRNVTLALLPIALSQLRIEFEVVRARPTRNPGGPVDTERG